MKQKFDRIIIGAGLYGLYAAHLCGKKGEHVCLLEKDKKAFGRATWINQARVHQGYHYPRSLSTAMKSAGYFERFCRDYGFCINGEFDQIYATSAEYSWTNAEQFKAFCKAANIPCTEVPLDNYFNERLCDGAFLTREYTYDAVILRDYFLDEISKMPNVEIRFGSQITKITNIGSEYEIELEAQEETVTSPFVLNATYASTNEISQMAGYDTIQIKYELCEIIICDVNEKLKDVGITVMDGPFFSIMPFGKTGLHSLTSVTFTPHEASREVVPTFPCQNRSEVFCRPGNLGNCNDCPAKPASAWPYMSGLAKKYLKEEYGFTYKKSLFSMKPVLASSEIDDSRPTIIRECNNKPTFISVLSGKINTVYDLDEFLK